MPLAADRAPAHGRSNGSGNHHQFFSSRKVMAKGVYIISLKLTRYNNVMES